MAWIKMREDLHEDPAVLWMAQQLSVRPETVVGYCHRFWGLVSRQTGDGCLRGPTLESLGNVLGLNGFPQLLVDAGWLEHDDSNPKMPVTTIPKFERHLSEGAKARALAAEKKRKQREQICPQKTGTNVPKKWGLEKRREEILSLEKKVSKKARFVPPSVEQVSDYCRERSNSVDAPRFVAYYEANGWRVGRNPMKDWRAAVRTWEQNGYQPQVSRGGKDYSIAQLPEEP